MGEKAKDNIFLACFIVVGQGKIDVGLNQPSRITPWRKIAPPKGREKEREKERGKPF